MPKFGFLLTLAWLVQAVPGLAGTGASGCDDLGDIQQTPRVDFQAQIQPILTDCANCHGESGPGGLDLRPGESYANLVGVRSTTNPSRLRVEPFAPGDSALFLAVACNAPNGPGFRMPGTERAERALIRDWISQGAAPEPLATRQPVAVPIAAPGALVLLMGLLLTFAGLRLRSADSI